MLGRCMEATTAMQKQFPELRVVKGHVYCPHPWGKRGHAWCVDSEGNVLDPTVKQFPGIFEYEEWKAGDEVRVGKCMDCGSDIWAQVESIDKEPARVTFCDSECESRFREYLEGGDL